MLSKEISKEVINVLISIVALTVIMIACFAIFGFFDITVIWGALLGVGVAFLNFLFLAFTVEKAVDQEQNPKKVAASSYTLRMIMIGAAIVAAIKLPQFNYVAMVIPLIFPRISIFIINIIKKRAK